MHFVHALLGLLFKKTKTKNKTPSRVSNVQTELPQTSVDLRHILKNALRCCLVLQPIQQAHDHTRVFSNPQIPYCCKIPSVLRRRLLDSF